MKAAPLSSSRALCCMASLNMELQREEDEDNAHAEQMCEARFHTCVFPRLRLIFEEIREICL